MFSILHVEHSYFYNEMIKDMVANKNISYTAAQKPEEAFKVLEREKISLIITAMEFQEESGEEFIKSLNESPFRDIPVIVLSAKEDPILRKRLFNLGVIDFINKNSFIDKLKGYINKYNNIDFTQEQLKKIKIAVLDDNEIELKRVQRILELNDVVNVDYYSDPEELLKSRVEYSLYLVDYTLPKVSGEQVLLELRARYRYALIIVISALENENSITNILNSGADDYITKPHSEGIFMARLRTNMRTFLLLQELKEKNTELERVVEVDGLTSLYNHKSVVERLDYEVKRCKRYKRKLSVVMMDIDKFKNINDTYGHQFGDTVLVKISELLRKNVRINDIVGRYGGEEFILIFPETDLEGAILITEKLRRTIQNTEFGTEGLEVTISGGIAELDNEDSSILIKKSDECMYKAKKMGRNRIVYC